MINFDAPKEKELLKQSPLFELKLYCHLQMLSNGTSLKFCNLVKHKFFLYLYTRCVLKPSPVKFQNVMNYNINKLEATITSTCKDYITKFIMLFVPQ